MPKNRTGTVVLIGNTLDGLQFEPLDWISHGTTGQEIDGYHMTTSSLALATVGEALRDAFERIVTAERTKDLLFRKLSHQSRSNAASGHGERS
jgi:hypothetical protein